VKILRRPITHIATAAVALTVGVGAGFVLNNQATSAPATQSPNTECITALTDLQLANQAASRAMVDMYNNNQYTFQDDNNQATAFAREAEPHAAACRNNR
jgi:hypothetical protein